MAGAGEGQRETESGTEALPSCKCTQSKWRVTQQRSWEKTRIHTDGRVPHLLTAQLTSTIFRAGPVEN